MYLANPACASDNSVWVLPTASFDLERLDVRRPQPPQLTFGPSVVGAGERFASKEREGLFEQPLLDLVVFRDSCLREPRSPAISSPSRPPG
jgi:hypothetical protein